MKNDQKTVGGIVPDVPQINDQKTVGGVVPDVPQDIHSINRLVTDSPQKLVAACERRYHRQVRLAADEIMTRTGGHLMVALSGSSAAGKTTTAQKIERHLRKSGIGAITISLDDFYLGTECAPLLPNGQRDYETVHALDIELMTRCLSSLFERGQCDMPEFDFAADKPAKHKKHISISADDVVIIEGIHALNPLVTGHIPGDRLVKIYVRVGDDIYADAEKSAVLLNQRQIRLARRLVRDASRRGSLADNTLKMWPQVVAGEWKYLFPYKSTADITVTSLHAYEPCLLKERAIELLNAVKADDRHFAAARELTQSLSGFVPLPVEYFPEDSLMREFLEI